MLTRALSTVTDVCKALAELKMNSLILRKSDGDQNPGGDLLNSSPGA